MSTQQAKVVVMGQVFIACFVALLVLVVQHQLQQNLPHHEVLPVSEILPFGKKAPPLRLIAERPLGNDLRLASPTSASTPVRHVYSGTTIDATPAPARWVF